MTATFSDALKKLLDSPVVVTVATLQPDGSPQLSPVWVQRDGEELLISTTRGRRKARNLRRDPRVGVLVQPADAPESYAEIRGTVTFTTDEGRRMLDAVSRKYTGKDFAEYAPESAAEGPEERVIIRITPHKVIERL
ncbi:PPOX class F420-dependent oxidoreductase [Streptomyces catenulae]|uniref:PPOX class F420-dependent oxidoreductase n=1 Tax=Streptomyces catenulae TaxID=66875 RepID=A0ABV2Z5U4_9ACTN|nr:PPOX class F420-dependent oxidoreductase [Streptomyces catenulae]